MKHTLFFTVIAAVMITAVSCDGQQQPKTVANDQDADAQTLEMRITNDILSLPEMQFPNAAVMIENEPTDAEPYFTVKGGSQTDSHFATSFWFHVYPEPEYEIKIYDVVTDDEMTLEQWRNANQNESKTVLGYMKLGSVQADGQLQLLFDDVRMIRDNEADDDYYLQNEVEKWETIVTNSETTYRIIVWGDDGFMQQPQVDAKQFKQHLNENDGGIFTEITISPSGRLYSVREYYLP